MDLLGGRGWGEICSLHMQLFTNTGNSKCEPTVGPQYTVLPHTAQPENAKSATPQGREERHEQWRFILTFTRFLGHLKLDEKLFQLLPHCRSSDEALVIQEMLLTPLGVLVVLWDKAHGGRLRQQGPLWAEATRWTSLSPLPPSAYFTGQDLQVITGPLGPHLSKQTLTTLLTI